MNIQEWLQYLNNQIDEAKKLSGKFPNLDICNADDGPCYYVNNPTENELLQATDCYLKSINYDLKLFYMESGVYVEILVTSIRKYKSLEDFANTICPGRKFLEKLKLLTSQHQFNEINRQLIEKRI